jgi:hypothetical protein
LLLLLLLLLLCGRSLLFYQGTRQEKALVAVPVTQLLKHIGGTGDEKLHVATHGGLEYLLWLQHYIQKEEVLVGARGASLFADPFL